VFRHDLLLVGVPIIARSDVCDDTLRAISFLLIYVVHQASPLNDVYVITITPILHQIRIRVHILPPSASIEVCSITSVNLNFWICVIVVNFRSNELFIYVRQIGVLWLSCCCLCMSLYVYIVWFVLLDWLLNLWRFIASFIFTGI
jgi:hypothetical protein